MNFKSKLGSALVAAAMSAAISAPAQAAEFLDFVVDEAPYGGGEITADKINGGYQEAITFDGVGGFTTTAIATFGLFFSDEGATPVDSELTTSYGLYAIFTAAGDVTPIGGGLTGFNGSGGGTFALYLDPDQDTVNTLGATGSDAVTSAGDADDLLLATSSTLDAATGILVAGVGGFFDLIFNDFALTADGSDYFIDPTPFYLTTNVDGDFDDFLIAGTQVITGDVSAVFVPEPGTLAVLGLGLAALGFSKRKKA